MSDSAPVAWLFTYVRLGSILRVATVAAVFLILAQSV